MDEKGAETKIIKQNKLIFLIFLCAIIVISALTYISSNNIKTKPIVSAPTLTPYCTMQDTKISSNNKIAYDKYTKCKPIAIFLSTETTDEEINSFRSELSKTKGVYYLKYISEEEALKVYKEQNKNDSLLLKSVTADMLPASLEVYVSDPPLRPSIAGVAKNKNFVKEVLFGE